MIVPKENQSLPTNLHRHEFTLFVGHLPALPTASSQKLLPSVTIKVRLEKRKSNRTTENTTEVTQKQDELKALRDRITEIERKISGATTDGDAKAKAKSSDAGMQESHN